MTLNEYLCLLKNIYQFRGSNEEYSDLYKICNEIQTWIKVLPYESIIIKLHCIQNVLQIHVLQIHVSDFIIYGISCYIQEHVSQYLNIHIKYNTFKA